MHLLCDVTEHNTRGKHCVMHTYIVHITRLFALIEKCACVNCSYVLQPPAAPARPVSTYVYSGMFNSVRLHSHMVVITRLTSFCVFVHQDVATVLAAAWTMCPAGEAIQTQPRNVSKDAAHAAISHDGIRPTSK